jgi:hypothetical protein
MFKLLPFLCMMLFSLCGRSQIQPVVVPAYARIPLDSLQKQQLISSLNGLLSQLHGAHKDNTFVQPDYLVETADLLDEVRGMGGPLPGMTVPCHCYLTNVSRLDSADYIVQFSYLGLRDTMPLLRASFKLVAHRLGEGFVFHSPLKRNTVGWTTRRYADFTFHYSNYSLNEPIIKGYIGKAHQFDAKLHAPAYRTEFFCCGTFQEALEALGVDYKLEYNGVNGESLTAFEQQTSLHVLGGTGPTLFDLHDLWHDRLHAAVPIGSINKPIDEACAYLYGGSWGLSWEEVFRQFKASMGDNRDWLSLFNENRNFAPPDQNHLYVSYVITALLVKKIEKEKGFSAVVQFLTCGKYQQDNENYFEALDRITGINRSNFSASIQRLMDDPTIVPTAL